MLVVSASQHAYLLILHVTTHCENGVERGQVGKANSRYWLDEWLIVCSLHTSDQTRQVDKLMICELWSRNFNSNDVFWKEFVVLAFWKHCLGPLHSSAIRSCNDRATDLNGSDMARARTKPHCIQRTKLNEMISVGGPTTHPKLQWDRIMQRPWPCRSQPREWWIWCSLHTSRFHMARDGTTVAQSPSTSRVFGMWANGSRATSMSPRWTRSSSHADYEKWK